VNKIMTSAEEAVVAAVQSGQTIAVGGFGLCGTPSTLIEALLSSGATDLHIIANNLGPEYSAITGLLRARRVRRVTASYIGDNAVFRRQYLEGSIRLDLVPQGTLAEKLRSGGAGIPAFYTPTGVGTALAAGTMVTRYGTAAEAIEYSSPREVRTVGGRTCVLEESLSADVALLRAETADSQGNLRFRGSARNFNPLCAMASRTSIVEVQHTVPDGDLAPDDIHLAGIFISTVVPLAGQMHKPIERRQTSSRSVEFKRKAAPNELVSRGDGGEGGG
jgi:3-oxoacid CoA-transferase subunit A